MTSRRRLRSIVKNHFSDKEEEMVQTGKNEYVLTSDEVENYSPADIKKSFDKPFSDEE